MCINFNQKRLETSHYDFIVVGSGLAGSICARELAEKGYKILILEKRNHIGGNAYDYYNDKGILVHKYGPHIFHTKNYEIFNYLSKYTKWIDYNHRVVADVYGLKIPIPFNFTSLEKVYGLKKSRILEQKLSDAYEEEVSIMTLKNNQTSEISTIGKYIFKNIYQYYTKKQWGLELDKLSEDTTERVPVRLSRDDRYFLDDYQGIPENGYFMMFEKILAHPNITLSLNTLASDKLTFANCVYLDGIEYNGSIIYTGAIDELFEFRHGRLPYRTLDFKYETIQTDYFQSHGTINYTVDKLYTRITEFKHMTHQKSNWTTIVKEYPKAYTGTDGEIPYYPIIQEKNTQQYNIYKNLAKKYQNLYFIGRLAEYKYYNMDDIVSNALNFCDGILKK